MKFVIENEKSRETEEFEKGFVEELLERKVENKEQE